MLNSYSYEATLAAQEIIHWRIEDIIGGHKRLDFTKPFMPESLAQIEPLTFLNREEKRILNQIRGNAYLCIFGLVEEFILPFVLDHARSQIRGDDYRVRALLQFAGEEAKHIQLFKRFKQEFEDGFGTYCEVIGPPEAIAAANASDFGLQAGIFTHDERIIAAADEGIEVGGLMVNDVSAFRVDHMPYGGVKESGIGREGIRFAMEEMTEPRILVISDLPL